MTDIWKLSWGDEIAWIDGTPGKGIIDEHSEVYTWSTGEDGEPTHVVYCEQNGIDWDTVLVAFDIEPDGGVWSFLKDEVGDEARRIIQQADSRLNAEQANSDTWNFTASEVGDVLDWDEGQQGLGILDRDGHVYTWDAEEYDTHQAWLTQNPEVLPMKQFWIDPDGKCSGSGMMQDLSEMEADVLQEADPRLYIVPEHNNTWDFAL